MPEAVFDVSQRVKGVAAGEAPSLSVLTEQATPLILRGIASHWPLLEHASRSPSDAVNYLAGFYNGRPSMVYRASSAIKGRYFYEQDAASLNYESVRQNVSDFLNELLTRPQDKSLYMASAPVDTYFPGLRPDLQLSQTPHLTPTDGNEPLVSIWVGNQSLASCHFDCSENIACCVAGKRRVVVFPPEQVTNLYPGPVEKTPGGQMISMVDFHAPDYARFPGFKEAIKHAQVAELGPGDGIFIPSMWWHQVEGLSDFNILVNFWATWCGPCEREMPSLAALQTSKGDENFQVVAISIDAEEDRDYARQRLQELTGGVIDFYFVPPERWEVVYDSGARGFPTTVIYDETGSEIARLSGEAAWDSYEAIALIEAVKN